MQDRCFLPFSRLLIVSDCRNMRFVNAIKLHPCGIIFLQGHGLCCRSSAYEPAARKLPSGMPGQRVVCVADAAHELHTSTPMAAIRRA